MKILLFFLLGLNALIIMSCSPQFSTPILYEAIVTATSDGDLLLEGGDTSATFNIKGRSLSSIDTLNLCLENNTGCVPFTLINKTSDSLKASITYAFGASTTYHIYAIRTEDEGDYSSTRNSNVISVRAN